MTPADKLKKLEDLISDFLKEDIGSFDETDREPIRKILVPQILELLTQARISERELVIKEIGKNEEPNGKMGSPIWTGGRTRLRQELREKSIKRIEELSDGK